MIYQKALKQLNTVFPKLSIKPPRKKGTVRSIIQQVECQPMTNNDLALLRNADTAQKPLQKLSKLISTWQTALQQNQKARQQHQAKPIDRSQIQKMQYMFAQCQQIGSKSEFIVFIKTKAEQVYNRMTATSSAKEYKEINICKQIQFYNTISVISQQQYFKQLEEMNDKLGILEQLTTRALANSNHLEQFHQMLQADELFKKKDNSFNKLINYNLVNTIKLSTQIEKINKIVYHFQETFTFSLVRCYYLLYLCRKQIQINTKNAKYLQQIQRFICERPQQIFIKLYNRKISKALTALQRIRQNIIYRKQKQRLSQQQKIKLNKLIKNIQQKIKNHKTTNIDQKQFIQIYGQIQNLMITLQFQLQIVEEDDQLMKKKKILSQCEEKVMKLFIPENEIENFRASKRKILSIENSRLASRKSAIVERKSYLSLGNQQIRNTHKSALNQPLPDVMEEIDQGQDVFLLQNQGRPKSAIIKAQQMKVINSPQQYEIQCKKYIEQIDPNFGQCLQDMANFKVDVLNVLIEAGSTSNLREKQISILINKNLIRPEITQQNLHKIFKPHLRYQVLKSLSDMLIQLDYKVIKMLQGTQFNHLPDNIKKFGLARRSFLKVVNKQIEKIVGISNIIQKIKFKEKYDICDPYTYETFLKILVAEKQAKAYQLSFRDEKGVSKQTSFFVNNKMFEPFTQAILNLLPPPYSSTNQIISILDELQFYKDLIPETEQIISRFTLNLQGEQIKNNVDITCNELARILQKWIGIGEQKLNSKKNVFIYEQAQKQVAKLAQIIKACQKVSKSYLQDPAAIKIAKLIQSKTH